MAERVRLGLTPVTFREACAFIAAHHRHHLPPQGWRFGVGVSCDDRLVGVVTVGRPVARHLDDERTLEVTRCCTDGTPNAASMLYRAAWRAGQALGYTRLITYTLASERGTSLRGAGYRELYTTRAQGWSRPSRERETAAPAGQKRLWEMTG